MNKRDFLKLGLTGLGAIALAPKAWPLEFYPTPSNKRIAVLFSTWCGTARDAGVWISEGMNGIAQVCDVREKPDLSPFEHIVIGGSIRSGKTSDTMQEYLQANRLALEGKVRGLFAVCGNREQPVTSKQVDELIHNHLAKLTGAANVPSRVFLGRITFGLMEPDVRERMMSFPGIREYDNLNRPDCMAFGKEVLHSLDLGA
jgi:menaquinone-dependent protoporphyrinogen IX oxidase